jgi:hypothetical protein
MEGRRCGRNRSGSKSPHCSRVPENADRPCPATAGAAPNTRSAQRFGAELSDNGSTVQVADV